MVEFLDGVRGWIRTTRSWNFSYCSVIGIVKLINWFKNLMQWTAKVIFNVIVNDLIEIVGEIGRGFGM